MTDSDSSTGVQKDLPFGATPEPGSPKGRRRRSRRGGRRRRKAKGDGEGEGEGEGAAEGSQDDSWGDDDDAGEGDDGGEASPSTASRGGFGDGLSDDDGDGDEARAADREGSGEGGAAEGERSGKRRRRRRRSKGGQDGATRDDAAEPRTGAQGEPGKGPRHSGGGPQGAKAQQGKPQQGKPQPRQPHAGPPRGEDAGDDEMGAAVASTDDDDELELADRSPGRDPRANEPLPREAGGVLILDKGGIATLRLEEFNLLPSKWDIYVHKRLVQLYKLREGMHVHGKVSKGFKHKLQLDDVLTIDGKEPRFWKNKLAFQALTSVDPDFHYATGDVTNEVAMRVVDLLAPIGRGQRALLVAPPRAGKTTLLRQFAAGIEQGYPDVHLFVLLIDERPEEATEWQRSVTRGKVYASTADEAAKHHIALAEVVWKRACRLVEAGDDVVLLLDSITRLARAYNNQAGSGRTMSGGLDSRAMERPRKIFGSARNTVEAGSLTIVGTCLIDTGSRMDQMVFEEFKGTGNSEIVLSRRLADRRIFPAIDVEKSGTRKEEKLVGTKRLRQIHTLRRVLSRMHFAEAMDLLVTRLGEAAKTADFLERFNVDPEA